MYLAEQLVNLFRMFSLDSLKSVNNITAYITENAVKFN